MELVLAATNGGKGTKVEVSENTFGRDFNEPLVHQVVNQYLTGGRSGTKAQKSRAAVRGGGKKPWSQKGSGRARAGTSSSPIWVGGGVTFAAKPKDYTQKVNKKMYRGAMKSILSQLVRTERLIIVDDIKLDMPKTKLLIEKLNTLGANDGCLIVTGVSDINLYLSARNVPRVDVRDAAHVDPVSLIKFNKVVMTVGAVRKLEEVLA